MNYSNLMEAVNARIKANGRREITGDILNDVLRAMVVELGAGYQLGGSIRPGDKPKDEDLRVAYLAVEPGMYLYAGGFEVTELSLITYGAEWYMYPLGVPFGSQIAEDIAAAVEAEKTRAMAAEKALSDEIDTERGERAAADSTLDSAIKAETKRATDAEGVLTKAVDDEKARAMAAEGANAAAIASEADAREQADTTLQGNISAEADAREAADEALAAKVTAEEAARKAADATLQANINTEESERKAADTALGTRVASIEDKIPAQASSENKLTDKDFVNSSIATSTATFRGTFDTLEALKAAQADKNDYAFWVHKDEDGNTCYDKYTYTGTEWKFEYRLNNSSFTAAQWAALNSGVTADVIKALQDADKANAKAIADEKAERIAVVAAETTAREQADTTLQGNISAEADAREAADEALAAKVTAEEAARKAADATLQANINTEESERKAADTALGTRVASIEDKIPAQASSENKLTDKDFVNSSIATSTATFRGTFDTLEALKAAQADKNDYAFWVHKDEDGNTCYDKYTYTGTEWKFEYRLNNSSFTAAQWAALNSGVTADVIKALQDADKANAKAIADEKAERIAVVAAETTAREQADTANAEAISTETAERKAADQTLQANIDKKVSKDDGTWLENFMPRIMLNGDGTTSAPTVGDNLVADYENTSYYLGKYGGVVTPFDEESVHGRVVQVKDLGDNKLYVTAIFNDGANFSDNYANSLYEIVLNFAANGSFANGTYTVKPLGRVFTLHLYAGQFQETSEEVGEVITDKGTIFQLEEDLGDGFKTTYPLTYGDFSVGGTLYFGKFDAEDNSITTFEVYTNDMSYDKFDDYSVRPRDIEDLKTQAANGQTAFGWGDHAKAGYTKAFIINLTEGSSAENPFAVDKTREEVAAALAANNLILLKANLPDYSEIYSLIWAQNYPTEGIMLRFGYMDKANLAYATMELLFSYQEGVNVTVSRVMLATDEQVKAKQDKLVSGTNIKTINGESILGSGDLKAGGLPTINAGKGSMSEVFNGIDPLAASGKKSHAEGSNTVAPGDLGAHAEGNLTNASGQSSHAEGSLTTASGDSSHSEGQATTANGANSHAEGYRTISVRLNSHAEGSNNVPDGAAIHQVGIGEEDAPKDAHRITYDGKHYILGIGGFDGTKATANFTNEKDLATVINGYETRIAALEKALAGIK